MGYEPFKLLKTTAVPLPIENVDTDQIIPARFLKATERKGFEKTYLEIGDMEVIIRSFLILYSTIQFIKEKFSVLVRILVQDLLENMPHGLFMITVLDV